MKGILVVVACGKRKVWDIDPSHGPARAADAYLGPPFRVNREYAEAFAERWVILSAKYGFISPDFVIPTNYSVTFKRKGTEPVSVSVLRAQAREQGLGDYPTVVGLGAIEYREAITEAFAAAPVTLHFPFAGLTMGRAMHAAKAAIRRGYPLPSS
jgi:hypothetical protein